MIHPLTEIGARYIAPQYYVAVNRNDEFEGIPSRFELYHWRTLNGGTTLPAFSTPWWCRDFVRTYWAGDNHTMPRPLLRGVFELAEVLEYLEDVRRVVFDPEATATMAWSNPQVTMSASYFSHFAREIRPDAENLFEEAEAQVGGDWFSNPDDLLRIKLLCEPSVSKVVRKAHARTAESEVKDF
jgi:hypothetical protein